MISPWLLGGCCFLSAPKDIPLPGWTSLVIQQPLCKMQMIQSPDFPGNPLPNSFQFINIFPILRCLKQGLFQISTDKCWEGHDHFHQFTAYAIISTAQDTSGFLAARARCCFMSCLLPTKISGFFSTALDEFSEICVGPFLQPVQIPLEGNPILQCNQQVLPIWCPLEMWMYSYLSFFNEDAK